MIRSAQIRRGWLIALLLLVINEFASAQSIRYSNFYNHPNAGAGILEDMVLMENGDLLLVGNSLNLSTGFRDGHHLLVNESGQTITEVIVASDSAEINPQAIIRSEFSQSIYSSGYQCDYTQGSSGYCDFYFSKLSNNGDTLFTKIIERPDTNDFLLNMVQTASNSILLLGWTYDAPNEVDADILIVAVDTLGNILNRTVFGGGGTDFISDGIAIDSTGDAIMVGYTRSFPSVGSVRSWVVKSDSIGNVRWYKTYTGIGSTLADGIRAARLQNGNVIISGGKNGNGYLQEVDTAGNEIWIKLYDVPGGQGLWGVEELPDGSIVSCGVTDGLSGSQAGWLIKTDANGDTIWTRTFDEGIGTDYLRNMMVMDNGDIVMVGFGRGENSTSQDGWILRVDSMGCVVGDCHLVGIEESEVQENVFNIYPNPATTELHFELRHMEKQDMQLLVHDMMGKEVWKSATIKLSNPSGYVIDVSTWAQGIYHCSLSSNHRLLHTQKVVLVK